MTSSDLHARVGLHEEWRILGLPMLPLTIGHVDMMERFGVDGATNATELATALIICSRPWREVMPFFQSRRLTLRLLVWKWALGPWDFAEKAAMFSEYIKSQTELPMLELKGESSKSGTPFCRHLRAVLLSELNYRPETVMDALFLDAMWDYVALGELKGTIKVRDVSEDEMERRMAAAIERQ